MDTYEVKVQLLQEQVEKLARENKELREMCLYLDHSSAGEESKLTPPEATSLLLHTNIMSKLNRKGEGLPQFTGATSHTTLKDGQVAGRQRKEAWSGMNTREALAEMKKRLDRLEKEKLELIEVVQITSMSVLLYSMFNIKVTLNYFCIVPVGGTSVDCIQQL